MDSPNALVNLVNVSKGYRSPGGAESTPVLREISLRIHAGDAVAVVGPSGCGKSTLLNLIGTLDHPDSGTIHFDGQDLTRLNALELAAIRNRRIGFIFQAHHLLPQCTVLENVLVPTLAAPDLSGSEEAAERARTLLEKVGLGARLSNRPGQLSGGERQRAAVVRALINRPRLLLADEPTGALDRVSAGTLADLLVRIHEEEGVTLVVVTHAQDLARRMKRMIEIQDGRLTS